MTLNSGKSTGLVTKKSLRKRGRVIKEAMKQPRIKLHLAPETVLTEGNCS